MAKFARDKRPAAPQEPFPRSRVARASESDPSVRPSHGPDSKSPLLPADHARYDAVMAAGTHAPSRPRIVLTKLRVSVAVTFLYALAAIVADYGFRSLGAQQLQSDGRVGQVSLLFAVAMAALWIRALVVINRRPSP